MLRIITAIETVSRHPAYQAAILDWLQQLRLGTLVLAGPSWAMISTWVWIVQP